MREKGFSVRAIAKQLSRSPNAISYEVRKNQVAKAYDPGKADRKAYWRRKDAKFQGMNIVRRTDLKEYVDRHLFDDQSPEAIAGRLKKHDRHLPYASKDSIRRYLQSAYGAKASYHRKEQKRRHAWRKKRQRAIKLMDRIFVDKRPLFIQKRRRIGDAEADFIVSGKSGKGILVTLADRKIRVSFLERIIHPTIPNVHRAFRRIQKRFPELKSITTDNDILFQHHKKLERLLGSTIYFCHPYHSWEKGTIENINKYIRKDIPKGSDLSACSRQYIKNIEAKLNRRYMAVLNHKTPSEMLEEHRKQKKRRNALGDKRTMGVLLEP